MVGFSKCDTNKKIDYKEVICELQNKINDVVEVTNELITENKVITEKQKEMENLYNFLMDEQGVKLPIMFNESTVKIGTIYRTQEGILKFKKSSTETKIIQVI